MPDLTRDEFYKKGQELPSFQQYKGKVGSVIGLYLLGALFEDMAKRVDGQGFWGPATNVNPGVNVTPQTIIKLKAKTDVAQLLAKLDLAFQNDRGLIDVREAQVTRLLTKAKNGELRTDLTNNTEPEGNYYTAPPPPVAGPGAPPIPPKPPRLINLNKAIAWATRGVNGSTAAFNDGIRENLKNDGNFPLGADEKIVMKVWGTLVNNVPPYRLPTLGAMYPSSFGGMHVLKGVLRAIANEQLPAVQNTAWENWALYFFGALMTSQPFPDGNKRISRVAYAIIMASADIPFRAPTDLFGSRLAAM